MTCHVNLNNITVFSLQIQVSRSDHAMIRNYLYITLTLRHGGRAGLFSKWTLKELADKKFEPTTKLHICKVCIYWLLLLRITSYNLI